MAEFRLEGLDKLQRKLKDLQRRAEGLDGNHSIPVPELLTNDFMARNSDFASAQEMFDNSGFEMESEEAVAQVLKTPEWDVFIASRTKFATWNDMLHAAAGEWTSRQLGLAS